MSKSGEVVPDYFLRLLNIFINLPQSAKLEKKIKEIKPELITWFETHFPDLDKLPGVAIVKNLAEEEIAKADTRPLGVSSRLATHISLINSYTPLPMLVGTNMSPALRVFLYHGDTLLLDSTGDWDSWIFVTNCITTSLADQAESISELEPLWKNLPIEKLMKNISSAKEALNKFEKHLSELAPAQVNEKESS